MDKSISRKINLYRFFFTLGIVLYHARSLGSINGFENNNGFLIKGYTVFTDQIGFTAMSFFFFTSGFLLYYRASPLYNYAKNEITHKISVNTFYNLANNRSSFSTTTLA